MFRYFPTNYLWSLAVLGCLAGGLFGEIVDRQIAKGNTRVKLDPRTLVDDRFWQYALQQLNR